MLMLRSTHEAELELIERRILELKALHQAELERWRAQVAQSAQEAAAARADLVALSKEILMLKREGFIPPDAPAVPVADISLDPAIQAAIDGVSWSPDIRRHLEQYAWGELERGQPVATIVAQIVRGEQEPPPQSARWASGALPADAPVFVMGDEEDDEDQ